MIPNFTAEEILRVPLTNRIKVGENKIVTFKKEFVEKRDGDFYSLTQTKYGHCLEAKDKFTLDNPSIVEFNKDRVSSTLYGEWRALAAGEYVIISDKAQNDKYHILPITEVLSEAELKRYKIGYDIGRPLYNDLGYHFADKYNTCFADFELAKQVKMDELYTEEYVTEFISIASWKGDRKEIFYFDNLKD